MYSGSERPQALAKFHVPVALAPGDELFEDFGNGFVEGLRESICWRIIGGRGYALDSELVTEPREDSANELWAVVMHNSPRHSIAVDDVVLDELHYVDCFDFPQGDCFRPFGEVTG